MANEKITPPLLEFLKRNRENPGVMADLRCALIPAREYLCWQYIARFCDLEDERKRTVALTVCAAFGIQPEQGGDYENIGDVMSRIACGDKRNSDGLSTFKLRFERLLACDSVGELSQQLHGIFKAAKARGIPINHENLWHDLFFWGDRIKRSWASHYISHAVKKEGEEDSDE